MTATDSITHSLRESVNSFPYDFGEISDSELISVLEKTRKSNQTMDIENFIFENFLTRNEPNLLTGLASQLSTQSRPSHLRSFGSQSNIMPVISNRSMGSDSMQSSRMSRASTIFTMQDTKRINLQTRSEILFKEKDIFFKTIEKYRNTIKIKRKHLKGEIEELELRIFETTEAYNSFESLIAKERIDNRSQRIPTEKYIRFLDDWLKSADSIIEKLRLRTSTLRYRYLYLQNQLKQKEELGEALHPVDLEQLRIERSVLTKKLEAKNKDLLEMKKKTGEANLELSKNKKVLQIQMKQLNDLTAQIKAKEQKIISLNKEIFQVGQEVTTSQEKLEHIQYLVDNYTVPDLMDYINNKHNVCELRRGIKIWIRRNKIQQSALTTCIKTMKRLTGCKYEDPTWFIIRKKDDDELLEIKKEKSILKTDVEQKKYE